MKVKFGLNNEESGAELGWLWGEGLWASTKLEDVVVVSGGQCVCWGLGPRQCQKSEGFEVQMACWGSEGVGARVEGLRV